MSDIVHGPPIGLPPDLVVGKAVETVDRVPWHMKKLIESKVWDYATGKGEVVAVLDTGCEWDHPDIPNPKFNKSFINGQSPKDPQSGHGTHCTGTAVGRNNIGVAPEAEMATVKVLSDLGRGNSSGISAGIRYAVDNGATIISMSLGGGGRHPPTEANIDYAWSKGVFVNAAAGNAGYNGSNTIGHPAKYDKTMCCGATQENGRIANFSSGGREIDWAGPGQNILSCSNSGSGYRFMSGTSMSTPWLSGTLALLRELMRRSGRPLWKSIEEFRKALSQIVEDRGPDGHDNRFGYGVPTFEDIIETIVRPELWT